MVCKFQHFHIFSIFHACSYYVLNGRRLWLLISLVRSYVQSRISEYECRLTITRILKWIKCVFMWTVHICCSIQLTLVIDVCLHAHRFSGRLKQPVKSPAVGVTVGHWTNQSVVSKAQICYKHTRSTNVHKSQHKYSQTFFIRDCHPSTFVNNKNIHAVCVIIEADRYVTYREIRTPLGLSSWLTLTQSWMSESRACGGSQTILPRFKIQNALLDAKLPSVCCGIS